VNRELLGFFREGAPARKEEVATSGAGRR
jgi:hypothetical protein